MPSSVTISVPGPPVDAGGPEGASGHWAIQPLQGWHLPLLDDPAFLPLQPLLQRSLLLAVPERLLTALVHRPPLASEVLVAVRTPASGRHQLLGLIISRRLNRSGTSWQVEHLRLSLQTQEDPALPNRHGVAAALLREAIQRARSATSWIATASSLDSTRLAVLREQGFQPQRTDQFWRWQADGSAGAAPAVLPTNLQLRSLNRRSAALLWHLEQATCPAQLRQLLDRRVEDLLDQSGSRGWLLVDTNRNEAVAGVRWLADQPGGGQRVEFTLHPAWLHLLGPAGELLLRRYAAPGSTLWLLSDVADTARHDWLQRLGAEPQGEQVLMARSVWRRHGPLPAERAARRIEAVLEQFQPRRRPLPTPVGPLGSGSAPS
ncbi:MAG: hypothetical protein WAM11_12720 [Cyanobium sp.]